MAALQFTPHAARRTRKAFLAADAAAPRHRSAASLLASRSAKFASAQTGTDAFFAYAQHAVEAQSFSDLIALSTEHSRRHVEMMSKQARELAASAQKIGAATAWPLTSMFIGEGGQMS